MTVKKNINSCNFYANMEEFIALLEFFEVKYELNIIREKKNNGVFTFQMKNKLISKEIKFKKRNT